MDMYVRRRYDSHVTKTVLDMVVECVRPRGRQILRCMDTTKIYVEKNRLVNVNILNSSDWRMAVSRATH